MPTQELHVVTGAITAENHIQIFDVNAGPRGDAVLAWFWLHGIVVGVTL